MITYSFLGTEKCWNTPFSITTRQTVLIRQTVHAQTRASSLLDSLRKKTYKTTYHTCLYLGCLQIYEHL